MSTVAVHAAPGRVAFSGKRGRRAVRRDSSASAQRPQRQAEPPRFRPEDNAGPSSESVAEVGRAP